MDFYETVYRRCSVRSYRPDPVPQEVVQRILEAARWAPSWTNKQCWHFIVVSERGQVQRLRKAGRLYAAPMYIVACGDPSLSGLKDGKPYYLVDVAIALEHLILAATAEGLGTCWIGFFSEERVKEVLGIPGHIRVVALTPLGYPSEDLKGKVFDTVLKVAVKRGQRKPLNQIVHKERW